MVNIKLIALDMDGTVLNSNGELSEVTRLAIQRAVDKGITVVAATGRAFDTLPKDLFLIQGLKYAITSNGAVLNRMPNGERIYECTIGGEELEKVLSVAERYRLQAEAFIDGTAYAGEEYLADPVKYGIPARRVEYRRSTRKAVEDVFEFAGCMGYADGLDIVIADEWVKAEVRAELEKIAGIQVTSSGAYLLEVISEHAGKGKCLKQLMKILNIKVEEIAAFGNADNDADLLKVAGIGIAVANSTPSLLEIADLVTESNDDDGVAYAFEHYLKI